MFKLESNEGGAILSHDGKRLRITFVTEAIARVTFTEGKPFKSTPSLIVTASGIRNPQSAIRNEETATDFTITSNALKLVVNKATGAISYFDSQDRLLVREPERGGKWLTAKEVFRNVYGKDARVASGQSVDGVRASATDCQRVLDRTAFEAKLEFVFGEKFF